MNLKQIFLATAFFVVSTAFASNQDFCASAALDKAERQANVDTQDTTDCEAISTTLVSSSGKQSLYSVEVACDGYPGFIYEVTTVIRVIRGNYKVCQAVKIENTGRTAQ